MPMQSRRFGGFGGKCKTEVSGGKIIVCWRQQAETSLRRETAAFRGELDLWCRAAKLLFVGGAKALSVQRFCGGVLNPAVLGGKRLFGGR